MDKDLIEQMLKYAEKYDNMAQYKNADILIKHIIISQSNAASGGFNAWDFVGTIGDIIMGRTTPLRQFVSSIDTFVNRIDKNVSTLEEVSSALGAVVNAANNAIKTARDRALTDKRGTKGTAEGVGLSPGARGSSQGAASGQDETARQQQLTNPAWFTAMEKTVTGMEILNKGLKTAWDRIGNLERNMRINLTTPHIPRQIAII